MNTHPVWLNLQALRWWRLLGFALVLLVVFLTLRPDPGGQLLNMPMGDKWGHLLAYGVLTSWFGLLIQRRWHWIPALLFVVLGISLEFIQGLTAYRTFEVFDMLANSTGVLLGYWLCASRFRYCLQQFEHRYLPSH